MKLRHDSERKRGDYQKALEFIGEARAGISRERFCMKVVANFDAFIDFLSDGQEAQRFLAQRSIERSYVVKSLENILERTHFNPENDHYLTLGLPHDASGDQIHDRWKRLMFLYHPDRNRDHNGTALKYAARINEVYSVLKDSVRRREYDRTFIRRKVSPEQPKEAARAAVFAKNVKSGRPYRISDGQRSILSRVILPIWVLICLFLLLLIFLENRHLSF